MNGKMKEDAVCKMVFFVKNFFLLYKQQPASLLWLSCIQEKRKSGLIYISWERKSVVVVEVGGKQGAETENKVSLWSHCSLIALIAQR